MTNEAKNGINYLEIRDIIEDALSANGITDWDCITDHDSKRARIIICDEVVVVVE